MRTLLSALVLALGAAACQPGDTNMEETGEMGEPAAEPAAPAQQQVAGPDTTGAAVWAFLQSADYQESWSMWPGKGEKYEGGDPHGMLLTTYVNPTAQRYLASYSGGTLSFPAGSIVVKENYTPAGELAAVTTMHKVPGYNPDHSDWFFSKHLPDGSLDKAPNGMDLAGRVPGCQNCHVSSQYGDYIMTDPSGGAGQ